LVGDLAYEKISEVIDNNPNIFCLAETWCTEERAKKHNWYSNVKSKYDLHFIDPTKERQMGRCKAGLLCGIRKLSNVIIKKVTSESNCMYINFFCKNAEINFKICFVYLPPQNTAKDLGFKNLIESILVNKPDIIMGDLNARVGANSDRPSRSSLDNKTNIRGKKLNNLLSNTLGDFVICNGVIDGDTDGMFTFTNANGNSVVDLGMIKTQRLEHTKSFTVCESHLSHHCRIQLEIGKGKNTSTNTGMSRRIKWSDEYRGKFISELRKLGTESIPTYDKLCNVIYKAAKAAGLKTRSVGSQSSSAPLWEDKELRVLKANYRHCVKLFRKCNPIYDHAGFGKAKKEMLVSKEKYLDYSRDKKKVFFIKIQNSLCNAKNSKQFWDALNIYKNKSQNKSYGDISLECWQEHFEKVFKSNYCTTETVLCETKCELLDQDFNMFELNLALKKLSVRKAPGNDGISNEVLKNLSLNIKEKLLLLFNEVYNNSVLMPEAWGEIIIVPIFKKGDANLPSNYRPISLVNTVTKLFTSLLVRRLDNWCRKLNKITEFQAGFKTGTGCIDQSFVPNTLIQNQL